MVLSCVLQAQTETDFMGKLTEAEKKMDVALLKGTMTTCCGRLGFRRIFCGILIFILPCKTRSSLPLSCSTGVSKAAAAGICSCTQAAWLHALCFPLHPCHAPPASLLRMYPDRFTKFTSRVSNSRAESFRWGFPSQDYVHRSCLVDSLAPRGCCALLVFTCLRRPSAAQARQD